MPDPYQVLGVTKGASFDEIKAAFRRLTKQRHPDLPGGSPCGSCWPHTNRSSKT
jgi:molecular chaperone DnaJ